ncbi:hypothetical protein D3C80_2149920 [compost metagenome]
MGAKDDDLLMGHARQHAANLTASNAEHLSQAVLGKATAGQEALLKNGVEDPRIEITRRHGEGQVNKSLR